MTNKVNKPKQSSEDLIEMLEKDKGVTFRYVTKQRAIYYLKNNNNYLRTASYRKNYEKADSNSSNAGKYINLDLNSPKS